MDARVASALITGGAGLLGGALSSSNMRKYNESQERIAREANEYNYRMFQEQNAFNLAQWERENEYNTPESQRQRYIDAGINPYMALGNMTSGNATGQVVSAEAKPAVTPKMNPNLALSQSIQQSANDAMTSFSAAAMAEKTMSEAELNRIDALTRAAENKVKLEQIGAQNEAQLLETALNRATFYTRQSMLDQSLELVTQEAEAKFWEVKEKRLQANLLEIFGEKQNDAQIKKLLAETDKITEETKRIKELLPFEKAESTSRKILNYAHSHNLNVSSWQMQQLTSALDEFYQAQAFNARAEGKYTDFHRTMENVYQDKGYWAYSPEDIYNLQLRNSRELNNMVSPSSVLSMMGLGALIKGAASFSPYRSSKIGFHPTPKTHGFGFR